MTQSTRYLLAGYDVVVPRQDEPWFAHEHRPGPPSTEHAAALAVFRARYDEPRAQFARKRVRRRARRLLAKLR